MKTLRSTKEAFRQVKLHFLITYHEITQLGKKSLIETPQLKRKKNELIFNCNEFYSEEKMLSFKKFN